MGTPFETVSMAEILLVQEELAEAERVIRALEAQRPGDPRVQALRERLSGRQTAGDPEQHPAQASGADRVVLDAQRDRLRVEWELTDDGLDLARRRVRYSGKSILRLFTAHAGPRGVRRTTRDFVLTDPCAHMEVAGLPTRAVHTAAVGFLGHNGAFIPMARALPVAGG